MWFGQLWETLGGFLSYFGSNLSTSDLHAQKNIGAVRRSGADVPDWGPFRRTLQDSCVRLIKIQGA